jgi:hypothetical protein
MLRTLDFNISIASHYRFLERFSKLAEADDLIFNYAMYLTELSLMDTKMLKWKPS